MTSPKPAKSAKAAKSAGAAGPVRRRTGPSVHMLLKYNPTVADTIREHTSVLTAHGRVYVGKFGVAISALTHSQLAQQISAGVATYLYLTARRGRDYFTHECKIAEVVSNVPPTNAALIPRYYPTTPLGTYFLVTSIRRLPDADMRFFYVVSSGRAVLEVLNSSSTSFLVAKSKTPLVAERRVDDVRCR